MKPAFAPTPVEPVDDHPEAVRPEASLSSDLSELTKSRLTLMVLLTTLAGYGLASHGAFDWVKLAHTLVGTALVAICSSILNQALERDTDALMQRTQVRPFVTRRLPLAETVVGGFILGALGLAELAWFVNALTMAVATATTGCARAPIMAPAGRRNIKKA